MSYKRATAIKSALPLNVSVSQRAYDALICAGSLNVRTKVMFKRLRVLMMMMEQTVMRNIKMNAYEVSVKFHKCFYVYFLCMPTGK